MKLLLCQACYDINRDAANYLFVKPNILFIPGTGST